MKAPSETPRTDEMQYHSVYVLIRNEQVVIKTV